MAADDVFLDNFPIRFNLTEDSCVDYDQRQFCQLATYNDTQNLIFKPGSEPFPITNGTFTGSLTGWTVSTGGSWTSVSNHAHATTAAGSLTQAISPVVGYTYKITFTISNLVGSVPIGILVGLQDQITHVFSNGTYTIYLTPLTGSGGNLFFQKDAGYTFDLDNVVVEQLHTDIIMGAYDINNGTLLTPTTQGLTFITNTGFAENIFTWADLINPSVDGCYQLYVYSIPFDYNLSDITTLVNNARTVLYDFHNDVIYVPNYGDNSVLTFDGTDKSIINDITSSVQVGPIDSAFDYVFDVIYIVCDTDDIVELISAGSSSIDGTINVGNNPSAIVYGFSTGNMYVCNNSGGAGGTVSVIDTSSQTVSDTVTVGSNPNGIAWNSLQTQAWVTSTIASSLWVIDGFSNTVTHTLSLVGLTDIGYDSIHNRMYICQTTGLIKIIDCATYTLESTIIPIVGNASDFIFDPIDGTMYIASFGGNKIYGINTSTNEIVFDRDITAPYSMEIDNNHGTLLIAHQTNTVSSIPLLSSFSKSECYNLKASHPCSRVLKWTNNKDGFGIPYSQMVSQNLGNGLYNYMRIESDIYNSKYPSEKEKYFDSAGNNKLYYANVKKQKELIIAEIPEYMHDALAIAFAHTDLFIDNVEYVAEDNDYTPEWSKKPQLHLAPARILVSKTPQDEKNVD